MQGRQETWLRSCPFTGNHSLARLARRRDTFLHHVSTAYRPRASTPAHARALHLRGPPPPLRPVRFRDSPFGAGDGHADAAVRCVHPARTRETPVHSRGSRHGPDHGHLRQAPGNDDAGRGSSHSASSHLHFTHFALTLTLTRRFVSRARARRSSNGPAPTPPSSSSTSTSTSSTRRR